MLLYLRLISLVKDSSAQRAQEKETCSQRADNVLWMFKGTVHTGHALLKKKKDGVKWHLKNMALPDVRQLFSM